MIIRECLNITKLYIYLTDVFPSCWLMLLCLSILFQIMTYSLITYGELNLIDNLLLCIWKSVNSYCSLCIHFISRQQFNKVILMTKFYFSHITKSFNLVFLDASNFTTFSVRAFVCCLTLVIQDVYKRQHKHYTPQIKIYTGNWTKQ